MGFETRDERVAVQGTHWNPMYPWPDGLTLSQEDRQMVVGVFPGILAYQPSLVCDKITVGTSIRTGMSSQPALESSGIQSEESISCGVAIMERP